MPGIWANGTIPLLLAQGANQISAQIHKLPAILNLKRHLLLAVIYLLLALSLTWPAAAHLTTHLPGDGGDDPAIAWNLWWLKFALLNLGQNPFHSDYMFYPIGVNLAFYTLTVLNAATALPFTLNFGVTAASNLHLFFTFIISGYGTFLLTRYILAITGSNSGRRPALSLPNGTAACPEPAERACGLIWWSAAIAGGFYAFAGNKLFYVALGQFNIASSHWIPLAALYIIRSHQQPRRLKNALLAGLFLILQAWAEMTYASFLLIFIGLYWLYWLTLHLIHRHQPGNLPQSLLPHLRAALVMGVAFTVGLLPILVNMLPNMLREGDFLVEGGGFASAFSADLLGFVIPTMHHPWLGHLVAQSNISGFDKGQHIYLGLTLLALLAIAGLTQFHRPQARFWLLAAAVFALLTLGPVITINGQSTGIPGPFVLFQNLPFFKGNRYPSRYSVMLLLSLSVIAGFALTKIGRLAQSIHNSRFTIHNLILTAIALLFLFEHLSLPLPQSDMRTPAAYQTIAAQPGDFAVLDIPFAWRNGFRITGAFTTQFMFGQFYQTLHQKRLLQGNTSRNPEFKFQYFTNAPLLNSLLALETGKSLPAGRWESDRAIAAETLRFFNIQYIVVRPEANNPFGHYPQDTIPYIENVLPVEKIHDAPAIKIYKIINSAQESTVNSELQIDAGSPLAPLYFGEGWGLLTPGQPITAQRAQARLLLPLTANARRVTLQMRLPEAAGVETRAVWLEANHWQSARQQVTGDWQALTFEIPGQAIRPGLNEVWLQFEGVTQLAPFQPDTPAADITVVSAGQEVGSFGHIFINGRNVSPNKRGYNVAIIQPGAPLQTASFDTHLDSSASAQLARLLQTAPPNATIALAAADEASHSLSEEAARAIQQATGAADDLRGCFRCSQAIIRPAGEPMLESLDPLRPVGLTTRLGLTEPAIAAVVRQIRVETNQP